MDKNKTPSGATTCETSSSTAPMAGTGGTVTSSGAASDIKSTAVVQYSSLKFPVQFSTIRLNTDLNHPPNNRKCAEFCMFPEQAMHGGAHQFSQFLSLNMAHTYKDLVGQVDVISSSKNIKALLKMPYSQSPQISIMVHRLGKTLLLEDFDVHKNLMKRHAEEWSWLKSYFNDVIAKGQEDKNKWLVSASKKRDSFTENIYLNLIRHSFAASAENNQCTALQMAQAKSGQLESIPDSSEDLKGFHHETLWEFEDISMLIDSDLPIFGSGETRRPCISLRLRDARSPPINVLTGLDYWLDNLMSNVPEVAMCYHVNGFVQKYEVMRTEDLPNLENSSFDPNEVLDIAQNLMSFIKRNAAVEGHTYWLYKSENDDMVKLYDLTDYCKSEISEGDNPFTVPVGLLCHRVGRNLKLTGQRRTADARAMFENCLRLLDESKHAQICADAHFHLSDMWVPDKSVNDIWQEKGKISEPPSDLYDDDDDEIGSDDSNGVDPQSREAGGTDGQATEDLKALKLEDNEASRKGEEKERIKNSVALKELVVRGMIKRKAWEVVHACRIAGTTDERCRVALSHIRKGLNCIDKDQSKGKNIGLVEKQRTCSPSKAIPLHYTPLNKGSGEETKTEEDDGPQMCHPFTAIPLHYKPLNRSEGSSVDREDTLEESTSRSSPADAANKFASKASGSTAAKLDTGLNSGITETGSTSGQTSGSSEEESSSESWHVQAKFQLLRKAAISYFVLAKEFFEIKKFGHTLRHLRYAMHCYEALELLNTSVREENQDKELYLMLLYLAAQARSCLPASWQTCRRDFEELGEEEAAILHSAQSVLATPKNSWVYEWPSNLELNLIAANELYEQALRLPILEKKPASFKLTMRKNHAACVMSLGFAQMEICKEKVNKKETFGNMKPMWQKSIANCQKAIKLFEGFGDRNTAGHNCINTAYLYCLAGAAIYNHHTSSEPFSPAEKEYLNKAVEWYEKALSKYERGEKMDDSRETVYNSIRMHYNQRAQRYISQPTGKVTEQDLRTMKELLQKSLSYCFLDSGGKYLKKSQICAAINHLNLARVFDVECNNCTNSARKKNLRQKMEENFQKACDLYAQIKWWRSEMSVKFFWIHALLDDSDSKQQNAQAKKKVLRSVMGHIYDLRPALIALHTGDCDESDSTTVYPSNISAVKQLLKVINGHFCSCLKSGISSDTMRELYARSLRLTPLTELNELLPPLISILDDMKSLITTDFSH